MTTCAGCGFVYASVPVEDLPVRLAGFGVRYAAVLAGVAALRERPAEEVWSPLEYTCHVRDVFRVQLSRLRLALATERPVFTPMGREELVVRDRYNDQDPAVVLAELGAAATALGSAFAALSPAELDRTGIYNWPSREERTMAWLGRHTVHEGEHHLRDVGASTSKR